MKEIIDTEIKQLFCKRLILFIQFISHFHDIQKKKDQD